MALARFYRVEPKSPEPACAGRTPVVLVLGDDDGEVTANYHGTTILAQALRGMWPEAGTNTMFEVRAVRPNRVEDLDRVFAEAEEPPRKAAAFVHEIVMMNYGARRLSPAFLERAYALCAATDTLAIADEIQSCLWCPDVFLFREYGLSPDIVAVGKGFSGGEYPASRVLFKAKHDVLPQFGALVTNGQEELASLAYLITMAWARANRDPTREAGGLYESRLRALAEDFPASIASYEGLRHLSGLRFRDLDGAKTFCAALNEAGYDISVQAYKPTAPPVALTKLPLTAGEELVEAFTGTMRRVMEGMGA
jgi:acetylornithine/succinyldiaminopimelate/putrescine aminotransferase